MKINREKFVKYIESLGLIKLYIAPVTNSVMYGLSYMDKKHWFVRIDTDEIYITKSIKLIYDDIRCPKIITFDTKRISYFPNYKYQLKFLINKANKLNKEIKEWQIKQKLNDIDKDFE